ncbi:MAG: hypothetical protein DDT19_00242 [Syntrophomonadaceae bacterium]|nr:hypothetical protein [Bacillota bacterium]
MNLREIRDFTRIVANEFDTARFTDARLNDWVNKGYLRIARYAESLGKTTSFTWPRDTRTHALPFDYLPGTWVSLSFVDDGREVELDFLNFFQMRRYLSNNDLANPAWWSIFEGRLWIHPRPDQNRSMRFRHKKRPIDLRADTDVPEIEESLHEAPAYYAAYIISKMNRDHEDAALYLADFQELVSLAQQITLREDDTRMIYEFEDY